MEGDLLFMPIMPQPSVDEISQFCAVNEPAGGGNQLYSLADDKFDDEQQTISYYAARSQKTFSAKRNTPLHLQ